jgi:hypothetical protein
LKGITIMPDETKPKTTPCRADGCKKPQLGFLHLKTGGGVHVHHCLDHLPEHQKDKLVLPEVEKVAAKKS